MNQAPRISKVPSALEWGTLVAAIVAAAMVYVFGPGLAWLPVLLVGLGTVLVGE